jgi:hypothetical protein
MKSSGVTAVRIRSELSSTSRLWLLVRHSFCPVVPPSCGSPLPGLIPDAEDAGRLSKEYSELDDASVPADILRKHEGFFS